MMIPENASPIELECKLALPERESTAVRLRTLGAAGGEDVFERNWVLDTPARDLRSSGRLLRIRTVDGRAGATVTVKAPAASARFKARREYEHRIDAIGVALAGYEALGYEIVWYYEKRRSTWRWGGCEIVLDRLPELGAFIEVEGASESAIAVVLDALGLDPAAHLSQQSYLSLFHEHCAARGEPLRFMEFTPGSADAARRGQPAHG